MLTNSQVGTYSYPAPGNPRPHAVTGIAGGPLGIQSFTYDANGSMTNQGGDTRTYDGENRLVSATDGAATTTFVYGPDGARLKKIASGVTTLYFGDDLEVIPGGTPQYTKYLPGDAKRVGLGGGVTTWLHRDHLQSVRVITDAAGAILDRAHDRPYGEQLQTIELQPESKGYIGQRHDDETGLTYLHARYYDPMLARFVQADPSDPALPAVGINRYAYALNNPVGYLDPSGLYAVQGNKENRDASTGDREARRNEGNLTNSGSAPAGSQESYIDLDVYDPGGISRILCACNGGGFRIGGGGGYAGPSRVTESRLRTTDAAAKTTATKVENATATSMSTRGGVGGAVIRQNAAQGAAYEAKLGAQLTQTQSGVVGQVTVKTQSGTKTRLDFVAKDKMSGTTKLTEGKSSESAPLTKAQAKAFPEIEKTGATVVGKGKPGFPGGTFIEPTKVNIVRPGSFGH